jgi:Fe-S oxidoreductase/nitrate reductase gamma subunit
MGMIEGMFIQENVSRLLPGSIFRIAFNYPIIISRKWVISPVTYGIYFVLQIVSRKVSPYNSNTMITTIEKILFAIAVAATLTAVFFAIRRLVRIISSGSGKADWRLAIKRLPKVLTKVAVFQPVFRLRFWPSVFHGLVGWGFIFYLLVNSLDVVHAYFPGFVIPGAAGEAYLFLADISSAAVLIGIIFLIFRRYIFQPANLTTRATTMLQPKARSGIKRDSAIVASFIVIHVGARFLGETVALAAAGNTDAWQPFGHLAAGLFTGASAQTMTVLEHVSFWVALGSILAFLPYFPYTKHVHLFFAPLNYLLKPERKSIGELSYVNLEDTSIENFGAAKIADLGWEQLMDAYSCIMCYRCQEVCPAYQTGKILSPAAVEINKRYMLNRVDGSLPEDKLTEAVIPPEAVWACTACGACIDICPVGNEPMRDIMDIRRNLSLMENAYPKQLDSALRGMERAYNPWNVPIIERMKWAEGLAVPTITQNPTPDILWWVGCAPAIDPRAQKTAQAFARILLTCKVNFAVLGESEMCTGDAARRAGREDIFFMLAQGNVAQLNEVKPRRIVTTCPHCLHTIKNEYPAFGGNYEVIHHSQLIEELIAGGKLAGLKSNSQEDAITFHDPCYLGRHNGILNPPRYVLSRLGLSTTEMPRHGKQSFCCGAGGAQMWKEEEHGETRVNTTRLAEARSSGAKTVTVGCPFCLTMLTDAAKEQGDIQVTDIAELVAERLEG